MSVNKIILVGNVGKQPEIKTLESGSMVANFTIATNEMIKGEKKTEWHNIVAWNKTAELISKYVNKGQQLYVEGKLQTRTWDDKDGNKKYMTEIVAWSVDFIGAKASDQDATAESDFTADQIPF